MDPVLLSCIFDQRVVALALHYDIFRANEWATLDCIEARLILSQKVAHPKLHCIEASTRVAKCHEYDVYKPA